MGRWLTSSGLTGWFLLELGAMTILLFVGHLVGSHDSLTHAVWSSAAWGLACLLAAFLSPKAKSALVRRWRHAKAKS